MIAALLLAGLLAGQSAPVTPADPLAPAREGKLRCVAPNPARLTCRAIIRYQVASDGSFDATVTGLFSNDPGILLRYKTFGRIEEGGICVMIRASDFQNGMLLSNGKRMAPNAEQAMRLQILDSVQPLQGKKRCTRDRTEDGATRMIVTLDGVAHPELAQPVAWVARSEGYAVGR
jgi:hypothetical protein